MAENPGLVRLVNKRAVVRALLRGAPASRADLAKMVGMSQVTAGKIVDALLRDGIVEEMDGDGREAALGREDRKGREGRMGRPGRMLQLNAARRPLVAVQLGVAHTRVARVALGLHRQDQWQVEFETPGVEGSVGDAREWKTRLVRACRGLLDEEVEAVMVSVPGVVDERGGKVLMSPSVPWLEGVNLLEVVGKATGKRVTLLQEIRALAYGQLAVEQPARPGTGAGAGAGGDFLLVDFGDGLGAAAVVGQKVYVGPSALNGELGHTPVIGNGRRCGCGAVGCVGTLVSRQGLLQSMAAATGRRKLQWGDLVEHVAGRGLEPWLKESLDHAATAIAGAANVMGIQRMIFTGSVTELPAGVIDHLSASVVRGCLWKRFGQVICYGAARHLMAGLVAAGMDRVILPVGAWVGRDE